MIWFTSDFHVWHNNILRLCNRPFNDITEMYHEIIDRYNSKIKDDDLVYILGDVIWNYQKLPHLLKELKGTKICILGNHDKAHSCHNKSEKFKKFFIDSGFKEVHEDINIEIDKYLVRLNHFPYYDPTITAAYELRYKEYRPVKGPEKALLCGHVHTSWKVKENPLQINVGVDQWDFYPISEKEILEIIGSNE